MCSVMPNILCLASVLWSARRLDPIRDGPIARMAYREVIGLAGIRPCLGRSSRPGITQGSKLDRFLRHRDPGRPVQSGIPERFGASDPRTVGVAQRRRDDERRPDGHGCAEGCGATTAPSRADRGSGWPGAAQMCFPFRAVYPALDHGSMNGLAVLRRRSGATRRRRPGGGLSAHGHGGRLDGATRA